MEPVVFFSALFFILSVGMLITYACKKLNHSQVLFLILFGVFTGNFTIGGAKVFVFPEALLSGVMLCSLIIITFNIVSRISLKHSTSYHEQAFRTGIFFFVLSMLTIPVFFYMFVEKDVLSSIIFAVAICITGFTLRKKTDKIAELLNLEAKLIFPVAIVTIFIVLEFISLINFQLTLLDFFKRIAISIGSGVFISMASIFVLKQVSSRYASVAMLLASVFFTYFAAETLSGIGIIALIIYGLFYANFLTRNKAFEQRLFSLKSEVISVPLFIMLGYLIQLRTDIYYFQISVILFFIIIILRLISVFISHSHDSLSSRNKIMLSLSGIRSEALSAIILYLLFLYPGFWTAAYTLSLIVILNLILIQILNFIESKQSE